jgi:hypothetical protein
MNDIKYLSRIDPRSPKAVNNSIEPARYVVALVALDFP